MARLDEFPPRSPSPAPGAPPRYLQLYQVLRCRLEEGRWTRGQMLPPIPQMMDEFGVSAITVRHALARLEAEGIVLRRRGIGTTVERDLTNSRWVNLPTTLDELVASMATVKPRVLAIERTATLPDVPLAADERPADRYVRMRRVHMRDGSPYCLIDLALEDSIYRRAPVRFRKHPVLSVMSEQPDLSIAAARQRLTIRSADDDEARHLAIETGAPVADVRRSIMDERGTVIYAAVVLYPSRTVQLDMNLLIHKGR